MSARTFEALRYEVADGVATVTLHRPDKLNPWWPERRFEP